MKRLFVPFFMYCIVSSSLNGDEITELALKLNLHAGTKATVQWERIFSSQRHLKKYKLTDIPEETRYKLKEYLIKHAADSEQPIVPGLYL